MIPVDVDLIDGLELNSRRSNDCIIRHASKRCPHSDLIGFIEFIARLKTPLAEKIAVVILLIEKVVASSPVDAVGQSLKETHCRKELSAAFRYINCFQHSHSISGCDNGRSNLCTKSPESSVETKLADSLR